MTVNSAGKANHSPTFRCHPYSCAVDLPAGNFIASADVKDPLPLSTLVTGLGLPDAQASGRVIVTARDGKVSVAAQGKEIVAAQALAADARGVLHLEAGKFGHVLLFQPVK